MSASTGEQVLFKKEKENHDHFKRHFYITASHISELLRPCETDVLQLGLKVSR